MFGCATSPEKVELNEKGIPIWLNDASNLCDDNEMCASATGQSYEQAVSNAKTSLAATFKTSIKSNFQVATFSSNLGGTQSIQDVVKDKVNEEVSGILKAVYVKQKFKKAQKEHYALVAIDKPLAAKSLKYEIATLDEKLSFYMQQKRRTNQFELITLYNKRSALNDKLIILIGSGVEEIYSYGDVKNIVNQEPTLVRFEADKSTPGSLKKWYSSLLHQSGFSLNNETATYFVEMKTKLKEEYLNVKGFKKFSYTVNVIVKDKLKNKVGSYVVTEVSSGRDENDAFLKAKQALFDNLKDNFYKLNME